jgi:autotransporter-associated beta strand protein
MTFAPAIGTTERIYDVIADQTGSGGADANAGAGTIVLDGAGALDLIAANKFTGGVKIDEGVLELATAGAAGSGGIDFAATSGEVEDAASANLANTISGFGASDKIDFSRVAFATGDHAVDKAGNVSIETSAGSTVASFEVAGTYTSANFKIRADSSDHVLVTFVAGGASTGSSGAVAFDSWAALASSAGTDLGRFDFHTHTNVGGAHDAWGVGGRWNGSTGHRPGPGSSYCRPAGASRRSKPPVRHGDEGANARRRFFAFRRVRRERRRAPVRSPASPRSERALA